MAAATALWWSSSIALRAIWPENVKRRDLHTCMHDRIRTTLTWVGHGSEGRTARERRIERKGEEMGKVWFIDTEGNCGRPWSCVWAVFVSLQWTHRVLDLRPLSGDLALPRRVRACKRWIIHLLWTRQMPPCIVCRSRGCAEPVEACSQHVNWTELQSARTPCSVNSRIGTRVENWPSTVRAVPPQPVNAPYSRDVAARDQWTCRVM